MTKAELIAVVADKSGLSKKNSGEAVEAVFEAITESLKKGDKLSVVGFGTFEIKERPARKGVNPRTKETIDIAACKVPVFKAGKGLKDAVK